MLDACLWQDMETNRTYITDVFGNWTINKVCLNTSIVIRNAKRF